MSFLKTPIISNKKLRALKSLRIWILVKHFDFTHIEYFLIKNESECYHIFDFAFPIFSETFFSNVCLNCENYFPHCLEPQINILNTWFRCIEKSVEINWNIF